jgi:hypothetical protein
VLGHLRTGLQQVDEGASPANEIPWRQR